MNPLALIPLALAAIFLLSVALGFLAGFIFELHKVGREIDEEETP